MDLTVGDLVISCDVVLHPLLGDAFVICDRAGEPLTAMSALDFDRPHEIPVIEVPRALPPGAGSLLINFIAERARDAGVTALRYAGPYNTAQLFSALRRSFRTTGDEAQFTGDGLRRALALDRTPVAVDFAPAPHRRVPFARGWAEVRDGVEYAVIDAVGYGGDSDGFHPMEDGVATLDFGGTATCAVAGFAPDGTLRDGPHPIPRFGEDVLDKAFPNELRAVIAAWVADYVAEPLRVAAEAAVGARTLEWADLGARAAARTSTGFALHAGLWQGARGKPIAALAGALGSALGTIVAATIVEELQPRLPA